jgi:hypothetical protein
MREHIARFANGYKMHAAPRLERAWTALVRAARWTRAFARRALLATLSTIEGALLSAKGRERVHAVSVFALIFAFAVSSVDLLIAGGPELVSSARAATMNAPRMDLIAATSSGRSAEQIELAMLDETAAAAPEEVVALAPAVVPRGEIIPVSDLADATPQPAKASNERDPDAVNAVQDKAKAEA